MELRLTVHAQERMQEQEITLQDVIPIITSPKAMKIGETAIEYDGVIKDGRSVRVVVVKGSSPALVITVHEIDR